MARPRLVKLVRDGVGALLGDSTVEYRPIEDREEGIRALRRKLVEEGVEYLETPTIGELADAYEVLVALAMYDLEVPFHEVQDEAERKRQERGGFDSLTGMYVQTTAPPRQ